MATQRRPPLVTDSPERSLFERCLDLCSSGAEREKIRALAVRLHLIESASEWAILLLHAEGRALFGPRAQPAAITPRPPRIERRVLLLLGSLVAGIGVSAAVVQHAPPATLLTDVGIAAVYVGWAARSLTDRT
jgi:hypothetical protein